MPKALGEELEVGGLYNLDYIDGRGEPQNHKRAVFVAEVGRGRLKFCLEGNSECEFEVVRDRLHAIERIY